MTLVETTTNVTTNTPYIKILQGHDRRDGILGPPGSAGPPGRDSTNGRDGVKGKKKENKDQEMGMWFLQDGDFLVQIKQEHNYSIRESCCKSLCSL